MATWEVTPPVTSTTPAACCDDSRRSCDGKNSRAITMRPRHSVASASASLMLCSRRVTRSFTSLAFSRTKPTLLVWKRCTYSPEILSTARGTATPSAMSRSTASVKPGSLRIRRWEEKISEATSDSRSPTCACISSNCASVAPMAAWKSSRVRSEGYLAAASDSYCHSRSSRRLGPRASPPDATWPSKVAALSSGESSPSLGAGAEPSSRRAFSIAPVSWAPTARSPCTSMRVNWRFLRRCTTSTPTRVMPRSSGTARKHSNSSSLRCGT